MEEIRTERLNNPLQPHDYIFIKRSHATDSFLVMKMAFCAVHEGNEWEKAESEAV